MTKTIEQKYRRLSDVEHVLLRPGRYIGSVKPHTAETYVIDEATGKMTTRELTWNPGLLKLFDEIITNSVDHSKRPEGKHLDQIKVDINEATGEISVSDNGGIPVVLHTEYNEYVPSLIFGYLRSGSNFDDAEESSLTGQNGEGSSLVSIFSTKFTVETSDGKKRFKQTWSNNMREKTKPSIIEVEEPGFTKITFQPDYAHLGTQLDADNLAKIVKRVYDVAGCNPKLKVYLNGKRIRIDSFKDYVRLYADEFEYDENDDWQVGITKSTNGFEHVSFVNATQTLQGGSHIDYVVDQVVDKLREHFKTKYKIKDIKPAEIKTHMCVFINARVVNPRYDSQTKETLITEPREYKTSYKVSEKLMAKLVKSPIIESVLTWVEAKAKAAEIAQLKQLNKDTEKVNPRKILKLDDASWAGKKPEMCYLFIAEGDSAQSAIVSGRNPKTMGVLALRGKPLNTNTLEVKRLAENVEFFNILASAGLKIGQKVETIKQLRYGNIVLTTDADIDGHHIKGLMINNLYRFWPELFSLGVVKVFFTPLLKAWVKGKKEPLCFETEAEFLAWQAIPANADSLKSTKYFKGLGSSTAADFKGYLTDIDRYLANIVVEDAAEDEKIINLVFGKEDGATDKRKVWLGISDEHTEPAEEEAEA